ncbi:hypothetical protein Pint_31571 [Pistacia integerrima]|uniref:Uncharacterized protein n=1 Tax=Pistacia integerrima TaxID=434235 RepID=A0ACC0XP21_9ROSI|nr:hypothetical protein Pint_31571 [Pistacia integerrima]
MRSDGFEYLKENCPSLQSELLKTVAGCEEDCSSGGGKSRSVWAQLSDGGDTNGRRLTESDMAGGPGLSFLEVTKPKMCKRIVVRWWAFTVKYD